MFFRTGTGLCHLGENLCVGHHIPCFKHFVSNLFVELHVTVLIFGIQVFSYFVYYLFVGFVELIRYII